MVANDRSCKGILYSRTHVDVSIAAFWLDDEGKQKIIHLGSGSGSVLVCVLADNSIDFLRLMAIGYDELCWNENFDLTPDESFDRKMMWVKPNRAFQNGVTQTYGVTIPKRANEIIRHPA